jgi:hypothetical protein
VLENPFFTLLPTYKSGFALYLGADPTVIVIGRLMDVGAQEPIAQRPIYIVSLNDTKAKPQVAFTNHKGKFQLLGLKPGSYEIRLDKSDEQTAISFEVPEGVGGIYRLGEVSLKKSLTVDYQFSCIACVSSVFREISPMP